jgi:hypothetical protein
MDSEGRFTIDFTRSRISDLSVLEGIPIKRLNIYQSPVFDLSPVRNMPLKWLTFNRTLVTDLRPLEGLDLDFICFETQFVTNGMESLRKMKSLKFINGQADHFWQKYDAGEYPSQGSYLISVVESKKKLREQSEAELHDSLWKMIWMQRGYSATNGAF